MGQLEVHHLLQQVVEDEQMLQEIGVDIPVSVNMYS